MILFGSVRPNIGKDPSSLLIQTNIMLLKHTMPHAHSFEFRYWQKLILVTSNSHHLLLREAVLQARSMRLRRMTPRTTTVLGNSSDEECCILTPATSG